MKNPLLEKFQQAVYAAEEQLRRNKDFGRHLVGKEIELGPYSAIFHLEDSPDRPIDQYRLTAIENFIHPVFKGKGLSVSRNKARPHEKKRLTEGYTVEQTFEKGSPRKKITFTLHLED